MEKIESVKHFFVNDTENKATWTCTTNDVLNDIKFFMREYYVGFYSEDGNSLVIKFNNGQKFSVTVSEIK